MKRIVALLLVGLAPGLLFAAWRPKSQKNGRKAHTLRPRKRGQQTHSTVQTSPRKNGNGRLSMRLSPRKSTHGALITFPIPKDVGIGGLAQSVEQFIAPQLKKFKKPFLPELQFYIPIMAMDKISGQDALRIHEAITRGAKGQKGISDLSVGKPYLRDSMIIVPIHEASSDKLTQIIAQIRGPLKPLITGEGPSTSPHISLGAVPSSVLKKSSFVQELKNTLTQIDPNKQPFFLPMINLYWDGQLWIQYYLPTQTYYEFHPETGDLIHSVFFGY